MTLPTFLEQYCASKPTSPIPFGNSTNSRTTMNVSGSPHPQLDDYFSSKLVPTSSQLDERDLIDTLPPVKSQRDEEEMERITRALNFLSPTDQSPAKRRNGAGGGGGWFGKRIDGDTSYGSSNLSTPSLESDYSSLSASCSPLSTPLDYSEDDFYPTTSPTSPSCAPTSPFDGIAKRRKVLLPKLEIPPFQLDASYFTRPTAPPKPKPSSFQFDVSPPRRSKTAYSTSVPSNPPPVEPTSTQAMKPSSRSWNPEPMDLAGIIGERPGSPIRLRQKRRDNGFAF
ncbi:uncharacterized protein JCM6883_001141 [Sporobolomyces salmoneus]|uniref:uncharacterized protein n=1 Tax=Sporobolomyces salmoneus TaxID=183962 RepID=UPI0031828743